MATAATSLVGMPPRPVTCSSTAPPGGTAPVRPVPSRVSTMRAGVRGLNRPGGGVLGGMVVGGTVVGGTVVGGTVVDVVVDVVVGATVVGVPPAKISTPM